MITLRTVKRAILKMMCSQNCRNRRYFCERYQNVSIYFIKSLECQGALGFQNGAIIDAKISASSQLDANYSAIHARLHRDAGSWSAGSNDVNQWLQVDLGSQYTKVTRVATQGRNDAAQWVTKYKLQYSNHGVNFQYYKDQGKTIDKVKNRLFYPVKRFSFS